LNVPITSRLTAPLGVGSGVWATEVLLIADDPHSSSHPAVKLSLCDPGNVNAGVCSLTGVGNGVSVYDPQSPNANIVGGVAVTRMNVFQARTTFINTSTVAFLGVPIDPPGSLHTRTYRITNLRGNANFLGVSNSLIQTQIVAAITVNPPASLPVGAQADIVGLVTPSLTGKHGNSTFNQCAAGGTITATFDENFASAWKEKNIAEHLTNSTAALNGGVLPGGLSGYSATGDLAQDVPGAFYFSESGFEINGQIASYPTAPPGFGPFLPADNMQFVPAVRGLIGTSGAGVASQGTRLMLTLASVPTGVTISVPGLIQTTIPVLGSASGWAVLVSTDANGAAPYTPLGGTAALVPVTVTGGAATIVYEIVYQTPFQNERLTVPITVAFTPNLASNLPTPGVWSTAQGSYAPLSTLATWDTTNTAPIPRFVPGVTPTNFFEIVKCSCNLLFPWAVYTQGYDTGIAISNTTVDPFGTAAQSGNVTINYYSGGTPPPPQTTTSPVAAGASLVFTLSGGGSNGIQGISNGFAGYIITQAEFQYCHAYAYISSFGALPTTPGTSEGYLGLVLDDAGLPRTNIVGEVRAH